VLISIGKGVIDSNSAIEISNVPIVELTRTTNIGKTTRRVEDTRGRGRGKGRRNWREDRKEKKKKKEKQHLIHVQTKIIEFDLFACYKFYYWSLL
jgi:hypothetical protein